ncbi:MAG TPA: rod shape-determining protein RodA [Armatimonadota bacterium]|nr:rod shape-determining protein RodA [Armatimonadota bacterium]HPP74272.1 rod shape-determining protein RodA [Armatimonadota bacterium]
MVERRLLKNFDIGLVLLMLAITVYGLVVIYSASRGSGNESSVVQKQLMWAIAGLIAFSITVSIDHKSFPRLYNWIYGFNLLLLAAVLVVGQAHKDAQRWLGFGPISVQPSELAKISIIITLAVFLTSQRDKLREFKTFALSFVHIAVPMLFILKQPDLGTSLVIVAIWLGMTFIAGVKIQHLALFLAVMLVVGVIGWNTPYVLKDYQKGRLTSFLNPEKDRLGSGYHLVQSRIAIGSGQVTGKGYLHGTQGQLGFIPENHTDFIFTVAAEEFGFMGAAPLILMYLMLLWKGLLIMSETEDFTGRLIAAGIICMFLFHIFVNIGMTLGIMPITGVPLPLMSYGGSSLLANMIAMGVLVGVGMRRHKINF